MIQRIGIDEEVNEKSLSQKSLSQNDMHFIEMLVSHTFAIINCYAMQLRTCILITRVFKHIFSYFHAFQTRDTNTLVFQN